MLATPRDGGFHVRLHIVTGPSGAGKSTICAALATRGLGGGGTARLRVGAGPAVAEPLVVAELPAGLAELASNTDGPLDALGRSRLVDALCFALDELGRGGAARVLLEVPARLDPEVVVGAVEASPRRS